MRNCIPFMAALVVVALPLASSTAQAQQIFTIDVFDNDFGDFTTGNHVNPTITVGDTVRWVWRPSIFPHSTTAATMQAEFWDSGLNSPPFSFDHTFTNVGSFNYYCSLHGFQLPGGSQVGGMSGFVMVNPVPEPAFILLAASAFGVAAFYRRRRRLSPESQSA